MKTTQLLRHRLEPVFEWYQGMVNPTPGRWDISASRSGIGSIIGIIVTGMGCHRTTQSGIDPCNFGVRCAYFINSFAMAATWGSHDRKI